MQKKSIAGVCMLLGTWASSPCLTQTITDRIEYTVIIRQDEPSETEWYRDNIGPAGRRPWLEQLLKDAESGKLTVYGPLDEEFTQVLTKEEVRAFLYATDTLYIESPDPPYDLNMQVVTTETDISMIDRVKFRESWAWHHKKGLIKEVVAFAPMVTVPDPLTGEARGWKLLFWVKAD